MKPLILVVNDDGIEAPGFAAAIRAARCCGEVLAVAPAAQQTAMGRGYPRYPDLGIIEERQLFIGTDVITAYAVHSSPAHAVAYGAIEIADRTPDLVVSGINHGANLGMSITGSGTIGACLEAASEGIPAVAFSMETGADAIMTASGGLDFQYAERAAAVWIRRVLQEGMLRDCDILNVNIPSCPVKPEEYRITCMDRQNYYELKRPGKRNWNEPYTMNFEINVDEGKLMPDSDIRAVFLDRMVSVTPLAWDMTKR